MPLENNATIRAAQLQPQTLDVEGRTVRAVLATEQPVLSFDLGIMAPTLEVLRMDGFVPPESGQIPLLDSHMRFSIEAQHGSIRDLEVREGKLWGRLHFSTAAENQWTKVREGHVTDISIRSFALEKATIPPGTTRTVGGKTYTAPKDRRLQITLRWEAKEGSVIPIGADPFAKIRAEMGPMPPNLKTELRIMNEKLRSYLEGIGLRAEATKEDAWKFYGELETDRRASADALLGDDKPPETLRMAPPSPPAPPATPPAPAPPAPAPQRTEIPTDTDRIRAEAATAERTRTIDRMGTIRQLCGDDVEKVDEFVQKAVGENWTDDQVRSNILWHVRNRTPSVGPAIHSHSHDQDCNVRSLAAGMLIGNSTIDPTGARFGDGRSPMYRADQLADQDVDRGDRYRDYSSMDFLRECCRLDSGRIPHGRDETIRAAFSGTSLGYVFTTSVNARLMEGWAEYPDSTGFVEEGDVANFLVHEDIQMDEAGALDRHPRGATAKHATFSDSQETHKIARYSKQFVIDEQDIIDDNLDALTKVPTKLGKAARRLRPDLVYSLILANPTLAADSKAVFHTDHGNLTTAVLGAAGLKAALTAIGKQRKDGIPLDLAARWLIIPWELQWTAKEWLNSAETRDADETIGTKNVLQGAIPQTVPDARLDATGCTDPSTGTVRTGSATNWFLSAGGDTTISVWYLRGTGRSPQLRSFNLDRGQWGIGWDIKHDIGVSIEDYFGWHKSTGAG